MLVAKSLLQLKILLVLQIGHYEAEALEDKELLLVLLWTVFRIIHTVEHSRKLYSTIQKHIHKIYSDMPPDDSKV